MRSESVRFGRTLECECGAQLNFNFDSTASVSVISIQAKCPNCGKEFEIKVDTGAGGGMKGGRFEFEEVAGEENEVIEPKASPNISTYSGTSSASADSSAYDIFNEPK